MVDLFIVLQIIVLAVWSMVSFLIYQHIASQLRCRYWSEWIILMLLSTSVMIGACPLYPCRYQSMIGLLACDLWPSCAFSVIPKSTVVSYLMVRPVYCM